MAAIEKTVVALSSMRKRHHIQGEGSTQESARLVRRSGGSEGKTVGRAFIVVFVGRNRQGRVRRIKVGYLE